MSSSSKCCWCISCNFVSLSLHCIINLDHLIILWSFWNSNFFWVWYHFQTCRWLKVFLKPLVLLSLLQCTTTFFPLVEAKLGFFCLTYLETCEEEERNIYKSLLKMFLGAYMYTNKEFWTNTLFSKVHEATFFCFSFFMLCFQVTLSL